MNSISPRDAALTTPDAMTRPSFAFPDVIAEISDLPWHRLTHSQITDLAWAYYFFSVQFRENLEIARRLHPDDDRLKELEKGECRTDNLSPWPGIAQTGERMDHDEFMRRLLAFVPLESAKRQRFEDLGVAYLTWVHGLDPEIRAMSLASYEDGGLEAVFRAMLTAPFSDDPQARAFHHFLAEHVRFDSDEDGGHGALARHLRPDDRILPLWTAFRDLLIDFVPALRDGLTA